MCEEGGRIGCEKRLSERRGKKRRRGIEISRVYAVAIDIRTSTSSGSERERERERASIAARGQAGRLLPPVVSFVPANFV